GLEQATLPACEQRRSEWKLTGVEGDFEAGGTPKLKTDATSRPGGRSTFTLLKQNAAAKKETSGLKQSLRRAKRSWRDKELAGAHCCRTCTTCPLRARGGSNGSRQPAGGAQRSSPSPPRWTAWAQEIFRLHRVRPPAGGAQPRQELEPGTVGQRLWLSHGAAEAAVRPSGTAWQRWSGPLETPGGASSNSSSAGIDSLWPRLSLSSLTVRRFLDDETAGLNDFVASIHGFTARACEAILQGRIVSKRRANCGPELQSMSRVTAEEGSNFLRALSQGFDQEALVGHCASLFSHLNGLRSLTELLVPQFKDIRPEDMGDLVETEMLGISEAVEAAEAKFRELIEKSADTGLSGVHLEVNMRVFESCSNLMLAVKARCTSPRCCSGRLSLRAGARPPRPSSTRSTRAGLRTDLCCQGCGIRGAADLLVSSGGTKFEELIVCSQDIAASTAQLVVASRVKANPKSFSLQQLQTASKGVSEATGQVVAQAKSAAEAIEDRDALDFSALSITQTKRMEMNSQVRLLELEAELEKERAKLGELRRRHYRLAEESAEAEAAGGLSQRDHCKPSAQSAPNALANSSWTCSAMQALWSGPAPSNARHGSEF
uniref:I/LWEQ domain-containing protein n=1 Tax=Macrostomum lignano TaxID=282301 RepID=A0A1I8FLF9_9PLAT